MLLIQFDVKKKSSRKTQANSTLKIHELRIDRATKIHSQGI